MATAKKTRKRDGKKRKVPPPGKEARAVFSAALAIAKDLVKSKAVRINLDTNGNVDFIIDAQKLQAVPAEKFKEGLTRQHLLSLIATEFESLLKASTYSDPARGLQNEIPSEILNGIGTDEFLWRLDQVDKELVPPNLKDRVMLRQTSLGFVLQDSSWQVITKKHDQVRGKLSDIACGYLSLTYSPARTNPTPLRFGVKDVSLEIPAVREPNRLTLELHYSEVETLIETLTCLRDNLKNVEGGK